MLDCHRCIHYYVTWDKRFPHGCKAMGFKSKQLPSISVFASSNERCLLFKEKTFKRRAPAPRIESE
ncbi:MAG TPA: uracil-DNA glycosylase [Desulfobacteraceae bacterium]|nr:MAG: uracil-DNA glycosylase [Deltaproteobacteria bacterium]HDI59121.1 uracil-DNA glycosylase [Desulfobacteraceae bacterium]